MDQTDEQLALAAIGGDAHAFGILVERLRGPLVGYITGLTRSRDDAEEVAQEAFLAAWRNLDGLREPERIAGWIYRIARNLAAKKPQAVLTMPLEGDPAAPQTDQHQADRITALLAAVAQLSEPHREVISRKHFLGASGQQIAEQLGIAPGTVRSRLSRAYDELRSLLDEQTISKCNSGEVP